MGWAWLGVEEKCLPACLLPRGRTGSASCSFPVPGFKWPAWSSSRGSSSSSCSPTAPTSPIRRYLTAPSDRTAARSTAVPTSRRSEGLPGERSHGVRLHLRPRRLPRAGLHRGLSAPRLRIRPRSARRARGPTPRSRRRPAIPDEPLRLRHQDPSAPALSRRARSASCEKHYAGFFESRPPYGLRPRPIADPDRSFSGRHFSPGRAWAAATRPGHNYSYTNNWPPEPQVDNMVTPADLVWRVFSLVALLGGIGVLFAAFGAGLPRLARPRTPRLTFRSPEVALTPAQRSTAWFFFVMAALFLLQTLVGAASSTTEPNSTISSASTSPGGAVQSSPHLARAAGDLLRRDLFPSCRNFLAPMISAASRTAREARLRPARRAGGRGLREPVGEFADIHDWFQGSLFGDQGFEYLDSGRFWQVLLVIGLCRLDRDPLSRVARQAPDGASGNMPWLFFLAALAIPAFYAVGLLVNPDDTSRSRTTGASGSSTCGWRTSWSSSPPRWSPTSSCCSGWSGSGWR